MNKIFRRLIQNTQDAPFSFYVGLMIILIVGTALAVIFDPKPTPDINGLSISMPIAPVIDKQEVVSDTLGDVLDESYEDVEEANAQAAVIAPSNDYDEISEVALMPDADTQSSGTKESKSDIVPINKSK